MFDYIPPVAAMSAAGTPIKKAKRAKKKAKTLPSYPKVDDNGG